MKRSMFITELLVEKNLKPNALESAKLAEKALSVQELSLLSKMGDKTVFGVDALYEKFKAKGLIA